MATGESEKKENKAEVPMSSFMKKMAGIKEKPAAKKTPVAPAANTPKPTHGKAFVNTQKKGGNLLKKLSGK